MKLFPIVTLSIILLITKSTFSQNWRTATPYNGTINDLVFVDALTGYGCGLGAGIGLCTASGLFWRSGD